LKYLLDKGADPNIRCRRGYNCLHIAVQQERYIKALDLFLDYKADVNVGDEDNSNVVYWAVQGWLLRKTSEDRQEDRQEHLRVLDKILHLGADLDQENRYGMCARKWLEGAAPDVRERVARWEASKPAVKVSTTVQPLFPVNLRYPEVVYKIWQEMVPREGPAPTVQGELLRSVEKLREEAQQHANAHYRKTHKRMAVFLRDTLIGSGIFDKAEKDRIRSEAGRLMKAGKPVVDDQLYDHLVDQVCVFYTKHPAPIPFVAKARALR
jgi:Ankyrin repeats (many copies)